MVNYIRNQLMNSIEEIASFPDKFAVRPGVDFTRKRVFSVTSLIMLLLTYSIKSTANELLDFFNGAIMTPTTSALSRYRAKLRPEALQRVFCTFTAAIPKNYKTVRWVEIAVDGSEISSPYYGDEKYQAYQTAAEGKKFCASHLTVFLDMTSVLVLDGVLQPIHEKDERKAFEIMLKRYTSPPGTQTIFLADRGFVSWAMIFRLACRGYFYVLRTKDIDVKSSQVWSLPIPSTGEYDQWVTVEIAEKASRKIVSPSRHTRVFTGPGVMKDEGWPSLTAYEHRLRVHRTKLKEDEYSCIITNLPENEFPPEILDDLYMKRWNIETLYGRAKDVIGLETVHATRPDLIEQEIWSRLTILNFVLAIKHLADETISQERTKYQYESDFVSAANICIRFLRHPDIYEQEDDMLRLIASRRHPIRPGRTGPHGRPRKRCPRSLNHRPA